MNHIFTIGLLHKSNVFKRFYPKKVEFGSGNDLYVRIEGICCDVATDGVAELQQKCQNLS
jgi:hypothetical protein